MLSGRLKRNLKRCSTLRALRVESALSFRPKTSWNRVSAVSLAPDGETEREIKGEGDRERERSRKLSGENEKGRYSKNKLLTPHFPLLVDVWFSSWSVRYLTDRRRGQEEPEPLRRRMTAISHSPAPRTLRTLRAPASWVALGCAGEKQKKKKTQVKFF